MSPPPGAPPFFLRRVWLVWMDHHCVGVYVSRKAAADAMKLRASHAVDSLSHWVIGPYELTKSAMRRWRRK
jgi:hypothetical protein